MATTSPEEKNTSNDDMEIDEQDDTEKEKGLKIDEDIYIPPPAKVFCEVDTTGPRLMITEIVNENFKSYAGTHVIGPFHKVSLSIRSMCCLLKEYST